MSLCSNNYKQVTSKQFKHNWHLESVPFSLRQLFAWKELNTMIWPYPDMQSAPNVHVDVWRVNNDNHRPPEAVRSTWRSGIAIGSILVVGLT